MSQNLSFADMILNASFVVQLVMGLLVAALWSHPPEPSRCNRPRMLAALGGGAFLAKTLFEKLCFARGVRFAAAECSDVARV